MANITTQLPPHQDIPSAWLGGEIGAQSDKWIMQLSSSHLSELDQALKAVLAKNHDFATISKSDFVLPTLGPELKELRKELTAGRGFSLIKGLNIEAYSQNEIEIIFFGLGVHLGRARSQNAKGDILGHVRDVGAKGSDTKIRIYQTSERQTFHTDSCDVVGLICLKQAMSGGDSLLVSAASIYNEFLKRRPDLLPCLFDPIATDRRGEVPEGMKPFFEIPVFTWHMNHLNVMYQRQYIDSAQRFSEALRLTNKHIEALNLFDDLANDKTLNILMRLEKGDMQFVHNHSMLHDRTAFEDWPELENRRHLLRLWLSTPGDRPLPDCFAERFGTTTIGDRGGIVISH